MTTSLSAGLVRSAAADAGCAARRGAARHRADEHRLFRPAVRGLRESERVGRQRSAQRRRAGGAVGAVRRQDARAVLDDVRRRHRALHAARARAGEQRARRRSAVAAHAVADPVRRAARMADLGGRHPLRLRAVRAADRPHAQRVAAQAVHHRGSRAAAAVAGHRRSGLQPALRRATRRWPRVPSKRRDGR